MIVRIDFRYVCALLFCLCLSTKGYSQFPLNLPALAPGDSIWIAFDAEIDPATNVCQVSCQAEVTIGMTIILSDDPDTGAPNDPTVTLLADAEAPMAMCNDVSVSVTASGSYNFPPADSAAIVAGTTDNCGNFTASFNPASLSCANIGPNIITVTYTDESGNSSSCTATVTLSDVTPPTAQCQDVTVFLDGTGNVSVTGSLIDNGSSDNCGISSYSLSTTSFTCADLGGNAVTLTVTDANGLSASCAATITVVDTVSPVIACPGNITVFANANCQAVLGDFTSSANATDNCSNVVSQNPAPGTILSGHGTVQIVSLTATDGNGNTDNCTFNVTVQDTTRPVVICQDITVQLDGNTGMATANASDVDNGSMDNCGIIGFTLSQTTFTCTDFGANTVTLTATDVAGNTATCTATVTVEDPANFCCELPMALCQDITVSLDGNGNAFISPADVDNGSTADCGLDILSVSPFAFDCSDIGPNIVTLTVVDINENSSSCTATVTVIDNLPPTIQCPANVTVECGLEQIPTPNTQAVTATDNCAIAGVVHAGDVSSGSCPMIITRTYLATDVNGNTATCMHTITVADTTPPQISCPPDEVTCDDRVCLDFDEIAVNPLGPTVVINNVVAGGVTVTVKAKRKGNITVPATLFNSDQPVGDPDLGTPSVLYGGTGVNALDPDGYNTSNNKHMSRLLIIQDPAFSVPNDHILGDSLSFTFSEPVYVSGLSTVDFELNQITTGAGVFMFGVNGSLLGFVPLNSALGGDNSMQELYLNTYGVKKLVVYFGRIVPSSGGVGHLCFARIPSAVVTDLCSELVSAYTESVEVNVCNTQITRNYTAVDACGNISLATCVIDLTGDYIQPDIVCPDDITIGCEDELPAPDPGLVAVTDNCDEGTIDVAWVQDITDGIGCDAVTRRIYRATDGCGNEVFCVQYISREEIQTPPLQLSARVMLGGSMNTSSPEMYAMLQSILPGDQPYNGPPFNYGGGEAVQFFPANIVDWVFLLLRDPLTMQTISQRCALVTTTGDIVDLDGVSPVGFIASPDQYYVVVCHRNHLDVMSELPVNFANGTGNIDFTLGNAGMLEVNPGEWAMIKGDVNVDGLVNNTDMVALSPYAAVGYSNEYVGFDVNMDGLVNNTDLVILAAFAAIGYSQGF